MLSEQPTPFIIKDLPGMNNKTDTLDMANRWVEIAQNCRFEGKPGAIDKRDPVTYYNSSSTGAGPVTGLYRFYTSSGTIKFIKIHGTSAYVGTDSTGAWTAIRTGLTDGKRMSFVPYQDLLYMSNGFDNPFVYDGASSNTTWEMGACKAALGVGAGNLDEAAYYYAVTFDDDAVVNGAISNTITCTAAIQKIALTNIPLGPIGTTNRKIYRTEGGGSSLKLLATIADNVTTTYDDNIADGSLGAAYPSVTDDIPLGSILKLHRERLFISGDPNNTSRIYYSNVYLPHFIQQTTNLDYMEVSPEDNDEIMGIPIQLGMMLCIKKNTIRVLHITSAVSGADPTTWYADDPIAFVGSPAQWSITQTPYGVVFLGWDHWYLFDGQAANPIIDEFDTDEILPSKFSDTVGFFHKGIIIAAYSDKETAASYHNRTLRYNFKRQKLGIDSWTSATVYGANCFASKSGDDETGELYYGDSQAGYVLKEKESEETYRLTTKTECNEGSKGNIFVGGTETAPYIEIGAITSASAIPDDICIFWDNEASQPGSGWTEVTGVEGRMIKISTTSGSTGGDTGHVHSISGNLLTSTVPMSNSGDSDTFYNTTPNHEHTVSAQNSDAADVYPRNIQYRIFKKNNTTTEYEFPSGSLILYDQPTAPTGWQIAGTDGYYLRIAEADSTSLGDPASSTHGHDFDIDSDITTAYYQDAGGLEADKHPGNLHVHACTNTTSSTDMDDLELDYVGFTLIKKIGETDTWNGVSNYVYALYNAAGAPTGWTDVSATYNNMYLKISVGTIETGSAANYAHTHTIGNDWSGYQKDDVGSGYGGYQHQSIEYHRHQYDLDAVSADVTMSPFRTFKLYKKILGQMKDYNAAISASYTTGTYTAPSQQINAETLNDIYWNESISAPSTDDVVFYTRTGATQVACEAAAWSDGVTNPNGSDIVSTANIWLQYKIVFTADDTMNDNPRVYFTDGYVVKYTYEKGQTNAETSVSFIYDMGFRNFDSPLNDKSFKKIGTEHEATQGSFSVYWETENASNTFNVDLSLNGDRWDSFFHDTAVGKEMKLRIVKNDLYAFRISTIKGVYTTQPMPI